MNHPTDQPPVFSSFGESHQAATTPATTGTTATASNPMFHLPQHFHTNVIPQEMMSTTESVGKRQRDMDDSFMDDVPWRSSSTKRFKLDDASSSSMNPDVAACAPSENNPRADSFPSTYANGATNVNSYVQGNNIGLYHSSNTHEYGYTSPSPPEATTPMYSPLYPGHYNDNNYNHSHNHIHTVHTQQQQQQQTPGQQSSEPPTGYQSMNSLLGQLHSQRRQRIGGALPQPPSQPPIQQQSQSQSQSQPYASSYATTPAAAPLSWEMSTTNTNSTTLSTNATLDSSAQGTSRTSKKVSLRISSKLY